MSPANFSETAPSFLEKLACTKCSYITEPTRPRTICPRCGGIFFAQYDLEKVKNSLQNDKALQRSYNIWRYPEVMPVVDPSFRFTLGEGWTPLIPLSKNSGFKHILIKDEGQNPTGTFKARGLASAISKGCELGVSVYTIPTAGNAGAALAAYTACSGTEAHIFMPKTTPHFIQNVAKYLGGSVNLVEGLIDEAGVAVQSAVNQFGWFNIATFREPYRVEGKKTMGMEILEQLEWNVPDTIIYPVGGGTGIVGIWKAIKEFRELGYIENYPRMVAVQVKGCAPIVKAFERGNPTSEYWKDPKTIIPGLRVPKAFADYLVLSVLYESNGTAIAINDASALTAMKTLAKEEGIFLSPEGAATFAALEELLQRDFLDKSETIVCLGTGSGFIYPDIWNIIMNHNKNHAVNSRS
ncbi:MAG: threonine synthase [Candidatus Thorarchaeota archaeon]